jgi:MFS family permease
MSSPWSPLRIRVFRALWIAGLVSNIGTFMHIAAAGWTMTTLTESPTLVGLVQTAWAAPGFLLALHAGALADMIDRRRLIAVTEVVALLIAVALAVLQWTDHLSVNWLLTGTFFESIALTISAPAFMALTPEIVDAKNLPQAIGLDSISRNIAQSVGPALAGLLIALFNPGAVFALNAVSFIGIVIVTQRFKSTAPRQPRQQGVNHAIGEGIKHIVGAANLRNVALRLTLVLGATSALTSVMPVVAKENLGVSASGFGLLSGALGVGAVAAVWVLPRVRGAMSTEMVVLCAAAVWSCGTAVFANTSVIWVAVAAMLICGMGTMAMLNTMFSTFMVQLPDWVRGRGSSLAMLMVWLGASIGAFGWGLGASTFGVSTALTAAAIFNMTVALLNRLVLPLRAGDGDRTRITSLENSDSSH